MTKNNNFLLINNEDIYEKYNTGEELWCDPEYQRYVTYMKEFTDSFLEESNFDVSSYVGSPFEFANDTYQTITFEYMKDKKLIGKMNIESDSISLRFLNPLTNKAECLDLNEDLDFVLKGAYNVYEARSDENNIKCISILKPDFEYEDIAELSVFKLEHNYDDIINITFNKGEFRQFYLDHYASYDELGNYITGTNKCYLENGEVHLIDTQNEVITIVTFYDGYNNVAGISLFLEDEYFAY